MCNRPDGTLYIGIADNLEERVKEHKLKIYPQSFTEKYNCDKLVYFEGFENGEKAVKRERQMKKWKREWKINLIKEFNSNWIDISLNWKLNNNRFR